MGVVAQVLVGHGDLPAAQEGAEGGRFDSVAGEGHLADGVVVVGAEEVEGGLLALVAHRGTGGVQQAQDVASAVLPCQQDGLPVGAAAGLHLTL